MYFRYSLSADKTELQKQMNVFNCVHVCLEYLKQIEGHSDIFCSFIINAQIKNIKLDPSLRLFDLEKKYRKLK